ncbi:MAG: hypothetical protein R3B49_00360 [Phycisphaerales bacterium]
MPRSTGTVFVVAFVLGVLAFIGTLLFAPIPRRDPRELLSPEEIAAREAVQAARAAARAYGETRRASLIAHDWDALAGSARATLDLSPDNLWALADLMHAIANGAGSPEELREVATRATAAAEPALGNERFGWQAEAVTAWAAWFLDDPDGAREHWLAAADKVRVGRQSPDLDPYNRSGYLALGGDLEQGIQEWERAVGLGYRDFDYARVDYDMRELWKDPRFEAAIGEAERRREEQRRLREQGDLEGPPEPEPLGG